MNIFNYFQHAINSSESPIVYEFGACDGLHTNEMLNYLRQTNKDFVYHAFEPVNDLIPLINKTCSSHLGLFTIHNMAIGSIDACSQNFYKSSGEYYGSSSIRKPKQVYEFWKNMNFEETSCDVIRLDTHIEQQGLTNKIIDFIWSDIQGAEKDLILGGKQAFRNVRYFFTEFNNFELYEGQMFHEEELLKLLPQFEIVERYYEVSTNGEKYLSDILLKNKNL